MPERPEIRYKSPRLQLDRVCEALRQFRGLINPTAEALGDVSPSNLRKFIRGHARAQAAMQAGRTALGDLAEHKLLEKIEEGNLAAITFYLSMQCRDRGYILPRGSSLATETTTNVTIGEVRIVSVPSGRYLASEPEVMSPASADVVQFPRVIEPDDEPSLN